MHSSLFKRFTSPPRLESPTIWQTVRGGVDELASVTGAHRSSLYRLLRMLTGAGVFREEVTGQFALTPLSHTLRSEAPDAVRDGALFVGAPEMWQVWGSLRDSVITGESAFQRVHGAPMWEYITDHPE